MAEESPTNQPIELLSPSMKALEGEGDDIDASRVMASATTSSSAANAAAAVSGVPAGRSGSLRGGIASAMTAGWGDEEAAAMDAITSAAVDASNIGAGGGGGIDGGGGSSVGSSTNQSSSFAAFSDSTYGTNSGNSAMGFLMTNLAAAYRLSFSIATRPNQRIFILLVTLLELLQLLLIPVALLVSLGYSASSSSSSWELWSQITRYVFDPTPPPNESSSAVASIVVMWSLVAVSGCGALVWGFEYIVTRSGALPHNKVLSALKVFSALNRLLPLPMICIAISLLRCSDGAAAQHTSSCALATGHSVAAAASGIAVVVISSLYTALFQVDFLPSMDTMAQSNSRLTTLLLLGKLALAAITLLGQVNVALQASFVVVVFAVLTVCFWVFLPYYKNKWNMLYTAALAACLMASVVLFVVALLEKYDVLTGAIAIGLLVTQLITGLIAGVIVAITVKLRIKVYEKKLRAGTASLKYPFHFDLLLRACYNVKPFPNILLNEKGTDMQSRFIDKFPTSSYVHMVSAVFAFECLHDPRGMIVQARTGKRQDCYPDTKFFLGCLIQHGHDVIDEEAGGKREIETLLDSAQRHHKLAKTLCVKFWTDLSKNNEVDTPMTWQLMRNIHEHDNKAWNMLMGLLRKYPTNVRILRQYARFMDEVRNDKEASTRAFVLADQYEEDANSKKKRHHHRAAAAKGVRMAVEPDKPTTTDNNESKAAAAAAATESTDEDHTATGGGDDTASISSASGMQQGDELVKLRSYRKRFETSKSYAAMRLNIFFFLAIAMIAALVIAEYIAAAVALDKFDTHLNVVHSTAGTRVAIFDGMFYARLRETNPATGSCPNILAKSDLLETKLTDLFKHSKITTTIADIWATPDVSITYYVPGTDPADITTGTFYTDATKPLWDACLTYLDEWHFVCNPTDYWNTAGLLPTQNLNPHFRLVIDSPWDIVDHTTTISSEFATMINNDVGQIKWISVGLFVSRFGIAVIAFGLLLFWGFRSIGVEHRAASMFFREIPRSTITNITFKLTGDDNDATATAAVNDIHETKLSANSLGSSWLALGQVAVSLFILIGLGAAMFGVIIAFCTKYQSAGTLVFVDGLRKYYVSSSMFLSQEYAFKDPYSRMNVTTTGLRLNEVLTELKTVDEHIKYGGSTAGIDDYVRSDNKMYELWYTRVCPASLQNLTGSTTSTCNGLGQLLRRYMDSENLFAAAPLSDITTNNTDYQAAVLFKQVLSDWLDESVTMLYNGISTAADDLYTSLKIILSVTCIMTLALWLTMRFTVNRVAHETEQLIRMLVFVPVNDLESIQAIKDYLESESDISKATKTDTNKSQGEQQTKNLLDGCEDAVLVMGPLLTIEIVNPAAEKLTEFVAQDLLGQPIASIVPESIGRNSKFNKRLRKGASGGETAVESDRDRKAREITLQTKSGRRIQALVTISKSTVANRTSQALFIRDITPQKEHEKKLLQQQKLAEQFLSNIIPKTLVKQLADRQASGGNMIIAQTFEEVTVMFSDIVQFTNMSSGMAPEAVVRVLNELVSEWDKLALELGVEKIKTIGDCYMACTGVPIAFSDHADVMMDFCTGMQQILADWNSHSRNLQIKIRIGVHTGPVVAGVLGIHKMAYDLWGETVSTAERMESASFPDRIQVSETTYRKVKGRGWHFESRGKVQVKNRGDVEGFLFVPDATQDRVQTPDNPREYAAANAASSGSMNNKGPAAAKSLSLDNIHSGDFDDLPASASSIGTTPSTASRSPAAQPLGSGIAGTDRLSKTSLLKSGKPRRAGPTAVQTPREMEEELGMPISDSIPQLLGNSSTSQAATAPTVAALSHHRK